MNFNIYTNIEAHILRSKMNSIHERHVPLLEKPKSMNHTFLKITRWINNRQTKIITIPFHHIYLVTGFPMSKEFVILIPYEKVMPILVKMPKTLSFTKFHTFPQKLKIPIDEQTICLIFYLYRLWRKFITLGRHAIQNYK